MCIYIYIYMYVMYIYIYIHVHDRYTHIYVYLKVIYIYIYTHIHWYMLIMYSQDTCPCCIVSVLFVSLSRYVYVSCYACLFTAWFVAHSVCIRLLRFHLRCRFSLQMAKKSSLWAWGDLAPRGYLWDWVLAVVGRYEQIARRRVSLREHLHIPGAGGVADVDRVRQDDGGDVALCHLLAQPAKAISSNGCEIDTRVCRRHVQKRQPG